MSHRGSPAQSGAPGPQRPPGKGHSGGQGKCTAGLGCPLHAGPRGWPGPHVTGVWGPPACPRRAVREWVGGEALARPTRTQTVGDTTSLQVWGILWGYEVALSSAQLPHPKQMGCPPRGSGHMTRGAGCLPGPGDREKRPGIKVHGGAAASERASWAGATWPGGGGAQGANPPNLLLLWPTPGPGSPLAPYGPTPQPPQPRAEPSCTVPAHGQWVLRPRLPAQLPAGSPGALLPPTAPPTHHTAYL